MDFKKMFLSRPLKCSEVYQLIDFKTLFQFQFFLLRDPPRYNSEFRPKRKKLPSYYKEKLHV